MLKVTDIVDDERCFAEVRKLRWPNGVHCAHCDSNNIVKDGHDETQTARQRYECKNCKRRFDDLTNTIFAGRHQSLKIWIITLYLMGLNISNRQIAKELNLCESDTQAMTEALRKGVVDRQPDPKLSEEVEFDEVYVVAGHKGNPNSIKKKP